MFFNMDQDQLSAIAKKHGAGNWASYDRKLDVSFCGWMQFHTDIDSGASKSSPYFLIVPEYVDEHAMLVHKVGGRFVHERPKVGRLIVFDATKAHALLPEYISTRCVDSNSVMPQRKLFKSSDELDVKHDTNIRMVWKWMQN